MGKRVQRLVGLIGSFGMVATLACGEGSDPARWNESADTEGEVTPLPSLPGEQPGTGNGTTTPPGDGSGEPTRPPRPERPSVPRVTCDTPIAGTLPEGRTEEDPGFADRLAAMNFDSLPARVTMPGTLSWEAAALYALDIVRPEVGAPAVALDKEAILATGSPLGRGVLGAYVAAAEEAAESGTPNRGFSFLFLRKALHRYYACATEQPVTLADFRTAYGDFKTWPVSETNDSRPKGGHTRRFYLADSISVAETLFPDGSVRETEIVLENERNDANLLFWTYDAEGRATNVSTFGTTAGNEVDSSSPYTCMACHFERGTWKYNVRIP